jgi:hypothetical protein
MRRTAVVVLAALAAVLAPGGVAVAASPTLRASLIHTLRGCHVWSVDGKAPAVDAKVTVARGTRLTMRVTCPMDFEVTQARGAALPLGPALFQAGTSRTIVFRRPGTYRLRARNLQTPEQAGLQTLGPDNTPTLTVVVR